MKDKNGTIIKVGDTLRNKEGKVAKIENIRGVTMLVVRDHNQKITQTTSFRKIDLNHFEKVA